MQDGAGVVERLTHFGGDHARLFFTEGRMRDKQVIGGAAAIAIAAPIICAAVFVILKAKGIW